METDAERVTFADSMSRVIDGMTQSDTEQLKFLCMERIPVGNIEHMEIIDLLGTLHDRRIITANKYDFLIECLISIGRLDIAHELGCNKHDMEEITSNLKEYKSSAGLNSFIILLHTLADNMEESEVKKIVVYLSAQASISKGKIKMCCNAFQLMSLLLKVRHIQPNNLQSLFQLVKLLRRMDLQEKIKLYEAIHSRSTESYRKPTGGSLEENKSKNDEDDDYDKETDVGGWQKLLRSMPTVKHHSLIMKLGISEKKYKMSKNNLDQLLKSSFEQNCFKMTELENILTNMKCSLPSGFKEQPEEISSKLKAEKALKGQSEIFSKPQTERNLERYKMTAEPRGICLIFNNVNFQTEKLKERTGSDVDKDELEKVFTSFHFEIMVFKDLTKTEMQEKLEIVAAMNHENYDCFVCCILSHGKEGTVYGVDGESLVYNKFTLPFQPSKCRSLTGKPKLFFIQACQGTAYQLGEEIESDSALFSSIPNEADFLMAYATVHGYVSFRSKKKGSWFIQHLCRIFSECGNKYDVSDMLLMVNDYVSKENGPMHDQIYKQVPAPLSTLRKKIFFLDTL